MRQSPTSGRPSQGHPSLPWPPEAGSVGPRAGGWVAAAFLAGFLTGSPVSNAADPFIRDIGPDASRHLVLQATSGPLTYLRLLRGDTLDAILEVRDIALPTGDSATLTDVSITGSQGFYRVEAVPIGQSLDSDGDGLPDVYELAHRPVLDPLRAADGLEDPDGDGRVNLSEFLAGSDPQSAEPDAGIGVRPPRFAVGSGFSVAVRTDGSLWTWGGVLCVKCPVF